MAFRSTASPVRPHCVVVSRPEVRSPSEVVWSLCTPSTAHMAWHNFIDQAGGSRDSTPGTQFWRCGNEMPKGEPCGSLTSQELRSGVWGGCVIALCGVPGLTQRRGIRKRTWGRPGTMWEPGCAGGGGAPRGPPGVSRAGDQAPVESFTQAQFCSVVCPSVSGLLSRLPLTFTDSWVRPHGEAQGWGLGQQGWRGGGRSLVHTDWYIKKKCLMILFYLT